MLKVSLPHPFPHAAPASQAGRAEGPVCPCPHWPGVRSSDGKQFAVQTLVQGTAHAPALSSFLARVPVQAVFSLLTHGISAKSVFSPVCLFPSHRHSPLTSTGAHGQAGVHQSLILRSSWHAPVL